MRQRILENGAFTELQRFGSWQHGPSPAQYVERVRHYSAEIGKLVAVGPQDWMCEREIITGGRFGRLRYAGTHLSVRRHQHLTVENFLHLRSLAPELPIMPVIQGWSVADYLRCTQMYLDAGVDLATQPRVGVGSICRRQGSREAAEIFATLIDAVPKIRLHGLGVKQAGLTAYGPLLASADSLAWSKNSLHAPPLPGCRHRRCTNCLQAALRWRAKLLDSLAAAGPSYRGIQLSFDLDTSQWQAGVDAQDASGTTDLTSDLGRRAASTGTRPPRTATLHRGRAPLAAPRTHANPDLDPHRRRGSRHRPTAGGHPVHQPSTAL
ncbi:DUF7221 family queuine tRNA-ribosyltransferase-like protein [Nocardia abscessus]|uniref:deazapurine DNA modification protein DpdA family protein n=1 Tax=Nocardia abscessus TaxID=120957 RepID=UPI0024555C8B|nr:hypothetical protein [Nocardia abscessus]